MPRPIFGPLKNEERAELRLSAVPPAVRQEQLSEKDKLKLDRLLRKKRSWDYVEAVKKLDAGGHVQNQEQVKELTERIYGEFPELDMEAMKIMLGIVAKCYLGAPYEVHSLSLALQIIEHYKAGEAIPAKLEKARGLARSGRYAFIEVYTDCCRCVSDDGTVSVVKG